ncbi:hypothetical protein HV146_03950 [Escherichia coli]|uniref:Uncharacterized protein n=1 Tax=Escherichia whittamii TaxID=2762229 RepID=A0ABR8T7F0_9ESCH|nr:hypothetical protein [Escherichia whittamii]QLN21278.1 hypothetical protein HVZ29_03505 [Escherichia coli]QLX46985.1 hypothetical protein HV146_03950 [Escherichia coli]QML58457.1 hypothetical protein HVX32_03745 [Escherichia coli]
MIIKMLIKSARKRN